MATPPLILLLIHYSIAVINVNGKFYSIFPDFSAKSEKIRTSLPRQCLPQPLQGLLFDPGYIPPPLMQTIPKSP